MKPNSRNQILDRLRQGQKSIPDTGQLADYRPMVPQEDLSAAELQARFVQEAQTAGCTVYQVSSSTQVVTTILSLIAEDKAIVSWDLSNIPVSGLTEAFNDAGISRSRNNASARVGLTGADAGLAATGSLVLQSGPGRYRAASLLPPVHIAVLAAGQIVPDLESWWAEQEAAGLDAVRRHSNIVIVTGPSRTADIAMQLVMGMHGPRELHLILIDEQRSTNQN